MRFLKNLFDKLNDSAYCRYNKEGVYPIKEGNHILELKPKELLEVGRTYPSREHVMIAYFGEKPTRVLYFGENAKSMKKTIERLRIPSYPSNLGERIFHWFKGHLEAEIGGNPGPISLEQQVVSDKEHQFELVLRKFLWVYSGKEINSEFYEFYKNLKKL